MSEKSIIFVSKSNQTCESHVAKQVSIAMDSYHFGNRFTVCHVRLFTPFLCPSQMLRKVRVPASMPAKFVVPAVMSASW